MCNNFPNIRITEGNNFSLVLPLRSRTYVATKPIDEDIDPEQLENVVVTFGGVEYQAQRTAQGVQIDLPATLSVGTYNILLTADYLESSIRAAYESAVTIVPWSAQSTAEQYITGSPIVLRAAYVLSCVLTDAELEALKQECREKIAEAEQAKADAEAAKEHYDQLAEEISGVAQEQTLTQGISDIREDISHIDIDTTNLAKEVQVKDGNDTAISVSKEVRSELGTGSDTAAETGTLFAVVKWIKDKVKSIFDFIGTPAIGQPTTLFAAIAAGGGDDPALVAQCYDILMAKGVHIPVQPSEMDLEHLPQTIAQINKAFVGIATCTISPDINSTEDFIGLGMLATNTNFFDAFSRSHYIQNIVMPPTTDALTSISQVFYLAILNSIDMSYMNTKNVKTMDFLFYQAAVKKIDMHGLDLRNVETANQSFYLTTTLEWLDMSGVRVSNLLTNINTLFASNYSVLTITTFVGDHTIDEVLANNIAVLEGASVSYNISEYIKLNRASLRALINGLADMTGQTAKTLTIGSTNIAKLTAEDIAIATDKNWTLA